MRDLLVRLSINERSSVSLGPHRIGKVTSFTTDVTADELATLERISAVSKQHSVDGERMFHVLRMGPKENG